MYRLSAARFAGLPRVMYSAPSRIQARCSSGSPSPSSLPADHFKKTGEREASDPTQINMRSDEYSKSGGDDMVAEEAVASFGNASRDTNPASQKETAGKGNVVNPLAFSPASPELSAIFTDTIVVKGVREKGVASGQGVTKKAKKIEKLEINVEEIKLKPGR